MGVGGGPNRFSIPVGGIPGGDVNAGVHVSSADVVQNETVIAPRAQHNTVALFGGFHDEGVSVKIQHQHVGQRHHGVHQSQRKNDVHAVLDEVLLAPAGKEDDQRREGKDGDEFHQDPAHLGCTGGPEGVEFTHVVVGADVHGEGDGGDEHAGHASHAAPLFGH